MWLAEVKAKAKRKNQILFSKDSLLLTAPADIVRCHAVGQACSVVHTVGHALGYPMYALTAIVLGLGLDDCREPIEQRVMYYEQRLRYWMEYEKTCQQKWAGFLKK